MLLPLLAVRLLLPGRLFSPKSLWLKFCLATYIKQHECVSQTVEQTGRQGQDSDIKEEERRRVEQESNLLHRKLEHANNAFDWRSSQTNPSSVHSVLQSAPAKYSHQGVPDSCSLHWINIFKNPRGAANVAETLIIQLYGEEWDIHVLSRLGRVCWTPWNALVDEWISLAAGTDFNKPLDRSQQPAATLQKIAEQTLNQQSKDAIMITRQCSVLW